MRYSVFRRLWKRHCVFWLTDRHYRVKLTMPGPAHFANAILKSALVFIRTFDSVQYWWWYSLQIGEAVNLMLHSGNASVLPMPVQILRYDAMEVGVVHWCHSWKFLFVVTKSMMWHISTFIHLWWSVLLEIDDAMFCCWCGSRYICWCLRHSFIWYHYPLRKALLHSLFDDLRSVVPVSVNMCRCLAFKNVCLVLVWWWCSTTICTLLFSTCLLPLFCCLFCDFILLMNRCCS